MTTPAAIEYLYGIKAGHYDGDDQWHAARVVAFRITKKTPKRIYYVASEDWEPRPRAGFVNRLRVETDGEVYQRNRHWSAPDRLLYLEPPDLQQPAELNLATLRAAMAAAHPDRGGSAEAFIAARQRYETAKGVSA